MKNFKPRIKARIRKNKQIFKKEINNFFDWIKGAELIILNECNTSEDPVRPELNNEFRNSYGRKIYGVRYKGKICAVMCFGFTNEIPKTVEELDLMTKDAYLQSSLRDKMVELLDTLSYGNLLKSEAESAEAIQTVLKSVPIPLGKAITLG